MLSSRLAGIEPFHVMAILEAARARQAAGHDVIHLEVGEPDFATPEPIVRAGMAALANGQTFYSAAQGLTELRAAISSFYAQRYRATVDPQRILITPGASGALQLALSLLVEEGSEVLLPEPGYPCNRHFVRLLGGKDVALPVMGGNGFQPLPGQVDAAWSPATRALLLASPSNPGGSVLSRAALQQFAELSARRGGQLIVDEIYHGLNYAGAIPSAVEVSDDIIVLNSFSKYFQMTGWRVGWMVLPEALVEPAQRLAQNLYLCAPVPAQHAALAAFLPETLEILEARRAEFGRRRDFLLQALPQLGWKIEAVPEGAFYIYADVSAVCDDSYAYCRRVLEEQNVAITPGLDFGGADAGRYVRIAYTTGEARLAEAVERLARISR